MLDFQKVHSIFFKTALFSVHSIHVSTRQKNPPHTNPGYVAARSAAYVTEMVYDEPEKVLSLTLSCVFLSEMS